MAATISGAAALVSTYSTCIYQAPLTYHNFTMEPLYYSEYFDLPTTTIIDPFRNNHSVTIAPGPTTVVTSTISMHHEGNVAIPTVFIINSAGETVIESNPQPGETVIQVVYSDISTTQSATTATTSPPFSIISFSESIMTIPPTTSPISYATTCTISAVATPVQTDIVNAINQWQQDIGVVNRFLVQAIDNQIFSEFNDMRGAAEIGYGVAIDEPCQFQTLQNALNNLPVDSTAYTRYQCANNDLASVFGPQVLGNLLDLITSPPDFPFDISGINIYRCCNVLPDVQILFDLADELYADASSQPASLTVPIPDTCTPNICEGFKPASPCT